NFSPDHTRWETYECWPRYGVQYVGVRGRLGILSESYAYAPFRDRVLATRDFVRLCFEYAAEHKGDIRRMIEGGKSDTLALKTKPEALSQTFQMNGYVESEKDGKRVATEQTKQYAVRYYGRAAA